MKQLLVLLLVFCSYGAFAQDVIVKKDGSTILSIVLEINPNDIKYKKFSNKNGPTYTINKSEIMSINYENGDKDVFDKDNVVVEPQTGSQTPRLITKPADSRNAELLGLYNRFYKPTSKLKREDKLAKYYLVIYGVKSTSIMSNEDIEMKIIRHHVPVWWTDKLYIQFYINFTNKTDKTIYIDKGNCFRVNYDGTFFCYFDNSEQITVNSGGNSGATVGLGSIAGALGIGGTVGQLAGGVSVGGGSSHSVSTTYSQQRIIAIPPHGNINLTEYKQIKTKNGGLFSEAEYKTIEEGENLRINDKILRRGLLNVGDTLTFSEDESPYTREYIMTYSTDEFFSTYSILKAEVYIRELIGSTSSYHDSGEFLDGFNEYTMSLKYHCPKK